MATGKRGVMIIAKEKQTGDQLYTAVSGLLIPA
jgi:hypothetical protein